MNSTLVLPSELAHVAFQLANGKRLTKQQKDKLGLNQRLHKLLTQPPQSLVQMFSKKEPVPSNDVGGWRGR